MDQPLQHKPFAPIVGVFTIMSSDCCIQKITTNHRARILSLCLQISLSAGLALSLSVNLPASTRAQTQANQSVDAAGRSSREADAALSEKLIGEFQAGHYKEALIIANKMLAIDPKDHAVRLLAGDIYTKLRQYQYAIEEYQAVIEYAPNTNHARYASRAIAKLESQIGGPTPEGAAVTPGWSGEPNRAEKPSRPGEPGRIETPSRPGEPGRIETPSRPGEPGRIETPSRDEAPNAKPYVLPLDAGQMARNEQASEEEAMRIREEANRQIDQKRRDLATRINIIWQEQEADVPGIRAYYENKQSGLMPASKDVLNKAKGLIDDQVKRATIDANNEMRKIDEDAERRIRDLP